MMIVARHARARSSRTEASATRRRDVCSVAALAKSRRVSSISPRTAARDARASAADVGASTSDSDLGDARRREIVAYWDVDNVSPPSGLEARPRRDVENDVRDATRLFDDAVSIARFFVSRLHP